MNKQLITAVTLSALIAGLLGFYGGRIYERKAFRSNIPQRMQNFRNGDDNFQPGQGFPRNNSQGRENVMPPAPSTETTQTPEIQN